MRGLHYKLEEIDAISQELLKNVDSKMLLFQGEMGVGKTTLIKSLVKQLGVEEWVTSPTFSIVNEYLGKDGVPVYHFDLYRIETEEELYEIGFEAYLNREDAWCLIEWPERAGDLLNPSTSLIEIKERKDGSRWVAF